MEEKTRELLRQFEQDHEISVGATEALTYWVVYARIQQAHEEGPHHMHHGIKYVSGPNEEGNVLVMRNPFVSNAYSGESWGPMKTIDDFVKKALDRILADKGAAEKGQEEGCGTPSCG
jgi:hypothetical protein